MILHPTDTKDVELIANPYDPDNSTEPAALESTSR